jgi:hypothetical protein
LVIGIIARKLGKQSRTSETTEAANLKGFDISTFLFIPIFFLMKQTHLKIFAVDFHHFSVETAIFRALKPGFSRDKLDVP